VKILFACIPTPLNRFLFDLKNALADHCQVVHDHELFWKCQGDFHIVHIHWPEYVSYEIEKCLGKKLEGKIFEELEYVLRYWKEKARIVVTRHNTAPHTSDNGSFEKLYTKVYTYADAVIHMGRYSKTEYLSHYSDVFDLSGQKQEFIPHGNYLSLPNNVSKSEARRKLGVRQSRKTVLVFGGILGKKETDLIRQSFRLLPGINKTLLVPIWKETLQNISWIRLKYWVRDFTRLYYKLHPWYHFGYEPVPDNEVQYYLNAADVLLIPRDKALNSGNLILGFTFGKVVVGPDVGNIGEILNETGNPTFDPNDHKSASRALGIGLKRVREGLGEKNQDIALKNWNLSIIAKQHITLYNSLLNSL